MVCGARTASRSWRRRKVFAGIRVWSGRGTTSGAQRTRARGPTRGTTRSPCSNGRAADFTLATQNVDSLHLRAGSHNVLELHGSLREARCTGCTARRPLDVSGLPLEQIEHDCGGRWRPDIVWFGEALPAYAWTQARAAAERADVILVVGTSALVYPAAALATHFNARAFVAEINPERTAISDSVSCSIAGSAADVLPKLVTGAASWQ